MKNCYNCDYLIDDEDIYIIVYGNIVFCCDECYTEYSGCNED